MARNFIAFDLGAESGRAVLGSLAGGPTPKLTLEEKHRFPNPTGRINGHLHWNLLGQWEELKTGLRRSTAPATTLGALGSKSAKRPEIHGIGVDAWGVDFGLVGADGDVLGNPFHYRDARTDGVMERVVAKIGRERLFQATGVQLMGINSLYQLAAMQETRSPALAAAQSLLFMPDLFNFLFTGRRVTELSIASTSQMIDPRTRSWARELLEELGAPTQILPEIVAPGTVIGPLLADVSAECGLAAGTPIPVIAPGCHDTASAVAAVPVADDSADWCYISSGTWSLMGVEVDQPILNDKALQYNYTNEAGVGGKVRFLKNIMGLWLVQECRRHWQREGHDHSYAELTAMASRAKPFGAVFDPAHAPFGLPGDMPGKIERFCKASRQPQPGSRGETVRACLESLALTYRRTLEGLEDVLGKKIAVIHVVGGGCQNELLTQMTADACKRPVLAGPIEATAAGNVLVQAMASGDVKSLAAARQIVRDSFEIKRYEPGDARPWDKAYARYQAALTA